MKESVIDFPKAGLCPEIWEKVVDGTGLHDTWKLQQDVSNKLLSIMHSLQAAPLLPNSGIIVHITGSITSNQYTENADIDLHFHSDSLQFNSNDEVDELNKRLKAAYKQVFIGKHPIEIYYQDNKFQDYMSVGCYDVINDIWEVGPELADSSFNPYAEYYDEAKKESEAMASQIRNKILSIYETAIALKKNLNTEFGDNLRKVLFEQLASVQGLYDSIRKTRKVYSSPASKEEALQFRTSRKWHIADTAFKLFDKYGYLAILKQFIEDFKLMAETDTVDEEAANDIIATVKNYIGNADKLMDSEFYEAEQVDEGAKEAISAGLLAALLAVPGILPAKTVQKSIDNNQRYEMVVKDLNQNTRMVGKYTAFQAANIIARTLYAEARNDGKDGMEAVASVIYNRAEGDKTLFTSACLKPMQFSCWNKFTKEEADPKNFKIKIPSSVNGNKKNEALWKEAMKIAADMLADAFKPTTAANMYFNPQKCSPKWNKELTDTAMIGSHKFGTLKQHSPFV